jgi:hypothetical protein
MERVMDLDAAIGAHAEWKLKLRSAAEKKESLDVATISGDNNCPLGKWLHGEAKTKYGSLPHYQDCVSNHAHFHSEAGKVAAMVNQGKFSEQIIGSGSPFGDASGKVGVAIVKLKKEVNL